MKGMVEGEAKEKLKRMIKQIEMLKRLGIDRNKIVKEISIDYEVEEIEVEKYL